MALVHNNGLPVIDGATGAPLNTGLPDRRQHQAEVRAFLQRHLSGEHWELTLPRGSGNETYLARGQAQACFVKLGGQPSRYRAMASIGLTPPLLAEGSLEDGTSILVQAYIAGKNPQRRDYQNRLEQFANAIDKAHHSAEVIQALPKAASDTFRLTGMETLDRIQQSWERQKALVPDAANFIDESLAGLRQQVGGFTGSGLVASHNDICNANWIISADGQLYLVDLESMALDDPAADIGATLWWYYPPAQRNRFLEITGHAHEPEFARRMQVRMALHCLNILLPRPGSFDEFDPAAFGGALEDFRAILAGEENPQGYE
jgi:thiamine kinase-like enzyme